MGPKDSLSFTRLRGRTVLEFGGDDLRLVEELNKNGVKAIHCRWEVQGKEFRTGIQDHQVDEIFNLAQGIDVWLGAKPETMNILLEIRQILKPNGILRISSVSDRG